MAEKKITVVIDGQEFVSKAAGDAAEGVQGFFAKAKGWTKGFADLKGAWDMVARAVGMVKDAIVDSFAAYDELQTSQRKLEGTAKLTGMSLEYLQSVAKFGRDTFSLSALTANEFAVEMAKFEKASGGAAKATDLLSGFLNIGAARGMSAAQSMQAASQALLGIDEGTDKLFGKNPSGLWKDYEQVIGKSAGRFSDMDKQAALAYAVLQGGNATVGEYAKYLDSAQGKQAQMNEQLRQTQAEAGKAMQPLREFAIETLSALTEKTDGAASALGSATQGLVDFLKALRPIAAPIIALGTVFLEVFGSGMTIISLGFRQLWIETTVNVGNILKNLGTLVEKGGSFLKIFGVEVVASAGKQMKEAGQEMVDINKNKLLNVEQEWVNFGNRARQIVGRWKGDTVTAATEASAAMTSHGATVTATAPVVEAGTAKINAALNRHMGPTVTEMIGLTEGAIRSLGTAAREQLPPEKAAEFNAHMAALAANAEQVRERLTATGQATQAVSRTTKDIASEIGMVARGAIDAAGAFGVIDESAVRSLNSAVNIAAALGNMAKNGFSFAGVTGVIGGVASIVSGMMAADAERRRLLRENNTQLQRLREEGISLSTKVSGDKVSKIFQALSGADLSSQYFVSKEKSVLEQLAKFGVTVRDLEAVANEYGIQNVAKDGQIQNFVALRQLIEALKISGGVRVGQSFSDQLQFFRDSQRANGNEGVGGIQGLIDFLRNVGGVSALNGIDVMSDPAGAANALRAIFTSLNNAEGIDPARIGRLTGSQFSSILLEIIDSLRGAGGGSTGSSSTGGDGTGATGPTITSGGVIVPTKTLSDVLDGVVAQTTALAAYHVKHLDLATAHLNEAKMQTTILTDIADSVRPLRDGGITSIADKGLEAERLSLAAERGIGASF
jgi:hypothetical protein